MMRRRGGGSHTGWRCAVATGLAMAALVSACAGASAEYYRHRRDYQPELQAYVNCNYKAAHRLAAQPGEVSVLAAQAQAMCSREEKILNLAVRAYYSGPLIIWDTINRFKNGVTKMNVEWIDEHRAKRAAARASPSRARP